MIKLKEVIGENNIILQSDGKLLIRHYVGFVQINNTRVLIYPKVSKRLDKDEECAKSFDIMMKMLVYSNFYSVKKTPKAQNMSEYNDDLLEIYIGFFIEELLKQFQRDMNRGYTPKLENQSFIKGKVDFNETIKRNAFKKHMHYVNYDEFNEDTILNQIFKTVINKLLKITMVKNNKIKLRQLLLWLEDVEQIKITNNTWNTVNFTRQIEKYKLAFNLAKLFYYNSSPSINNGNTSSLSFLVPANQLFERYIFELLSNKFKDNIKVNYQGPISYLATTDGTKAFQLRPDITIEKDNSICNIIDAKYKIIEGINNIFQGDIYQMLAYSIRYKCNEISLIYPKLLGEDEEGIIYSYNIENYDKDVTVRIIKVDLEEDPEATAEKLERWLKLNF